MTGQYWDQTWNAMVGCDPVSAGCDFCFAPPAGRIRMYNPNEAVAAAWAGTVTPRGTNMAWTGKVNEVQARVDDPYRWRKPQRVYVTLVSDMFHAGVSDDYIARLFAVMATTGRHTYLCTTKRHGRMKSLLNNPYFQEQVRVYAVAAVAKRGAEAWDGVWPLPNLHLGVSVENQGMANLRIPALLDTPAAVRWISAEPLLNCISLCKCDDSGLVSELCWVHGAVRLDWVVTGGESGSRRATHPAHVRSLRDQCVAAGIPFWFKQWGDHVPADVFDHPGFVGDRAFNHPRGGTSAPAIREPGPSGTMRTATTRLLLPGERTKGLVMLDRDTVAVRVGADKAGRVLDGRTWDELPAVVAA